MINIAVYGFYYKQNLGDQFFIEAFKTIFPNYNFRFVEKLTADIINSVDAIFIGGGSFLYGKPDINDNNLQLLKTKKIFYIGVGVETEIHPIHLELLSKAKLIATRSSNQIDKIKQINPNTKFIPDLVYALQDTLLQYNKINNSVLIIPNIEVVPNWNSPYWKHSSWLNFKTEYSQFLDYLIDANYKINFLPMSINNKLSDITAGNEIINMMSNRNNYFLSYNSEQFSEITKIISQYSFIITQRYHGIILAEMLKIPYLCIHHHDKLKSTQNNGKFVSYYGSYKKQFIDNFNSLSDILFSNNISINQNLFRKLQLEVDNLMDKNGEICRD